MVGTDFDSLTGQWATQGPNLYLLMRLQSDPNADPDALLGEYYSAFGAASGEVKAYFDYWESYTSKTRDRIHPIFEAMNASRWRSFAKAAHKVFPQECFAPARALIEKAATSAAGDPQAAERIAFVKLGLDHAMLCSRVARLLSLGDTQADPEEGAAALKDLLAFRRAHERAWIANFDQCAWVEGQSWNLSSIVNPE
jgi:hypothetical protein